MRLRWHVEVAGDREQVLEHPPDADFLDRKPTHRFTNGAQSGCEFGDVVVRRHILRLEMNFGDSLIIAGDQAVEDFGQPQSRPAVDPPHDPEVDRCEPPIAKREQIALVKVGVEETVHHRLAKEGADQRARKLG